MSKIIGAENEPLVPFVKGVRPCGSQILVELLTEQERLNTRFSVGNKRDSGEYQGYIRAVGPSVKLEDWGFAIGNRVVISGGGVPTPNYDKIDRERVLMEPHSIKAVLIEEE